MKAHELAKKLLEGPDYEVLRRKGEHYDLEPIAAVRTVLDGKEEFWDRKWREEPYVLLEEEDPVVGG